MPAPHPALFEIAPPSGDSGWFDLLFGLAVALAFAWSLWNAHRPDGGFAIGHARNVHVSRDREPALFWVFTVLQALFCIGGLVAAFHGAAIVFLWTTR